MTCCFCSTCILIFCTVCIGFQAPFKEREVKASGQDKDHQTLSSPHGSRCNAPSSTFKQPGLLPPVPTRKAICPPPPLTPTDQYMPKLPASICKTSFSPTNEQVSRCLLSPRLSLGYKSRHDHVPGVGSPPITTKSARLCRQHHSPP